jgi:hypothetical protein
METYLVSWVNDDLEAAIFFVDMTAEQADAALDVVEAADYADPYVIPIKGITPISFEQFDEDFLSSMRGAAE